MLQTAPPPLVWNRGQNFSVCVAHSALQLHAQHTKDSTWNGFWRKEGKWTSVCFCKIISFSCVFFFLSVKNIVELENVFAVDWSWCSVWQYIGKALFLCFFVLWISSAMQFNNAFTQAFPHSDAWLLNINKCFATNPIVVVFFNIFRLLKTVSLLTL